VRANRVVLQLIPVPPGKTFIRGKSCPLAAITAHYPDACLVVEALLTEMIAVPVKNTARTGSRRRVALK
jgi:hypothetical protein